MSATTQSEHLLTAEEFATECDDRRVELVKGKVVEMSPTAFFAFASSSRNDERSSATNETSLF